MRILLALLWIAAMAVSAPALQEPEKVHIPTPREKALELLDTALDAAPGTQPEVSATALMRIGENYELFSHLKALEIMNRAFTSSLGIPPVARMHRERVQSDIVAATVALSLPDAMAMLRRIEGGTGDYDPRLPAIATTVTKLLENKQFDQAIDFINSIGATGQYAFAAANSTFEKLPANDPRRSAVFGYALSAYALRPHAEFGDFLVKHWKEIPRSTAEAAIASMVETVLNARDDGIVETIASEKGPLTLKGKANVELFDLMHIVRAIDPKRAEEILESRPDLKAALDRFPNGRESMGQRFGWSLGYPSDPAQQQQAAAEAAANSSVAQIMKQLEAIETKDDASAEVKHRDLLKSLDLAKSIPVPQTRIEILAMIANEAAADEPDFAKSILSECMDQLKEIKGPDLRIDAWRDIAEAAHAIKDDKLAWEAVDRALADAGESYKLDTDADLPNTGLRDQWPSTNAYRRVAITAVKLFSLNAEPLLTRIPDRELALYARVEMAQALLERSHENWMTTLRDTKK